MLLAARRRPWEMPLKRKRTSVKRLNRLDPRAAEKTALCCGSQSHDLKVSRYADNIYRQLLVNVKTWDDCAL
jgi:hypothetical protein